MSTTLVFLSFPYSAAAVFQNAVCDLFLFSPELLNPCALSWEKKEFEKADQILPRLLQTAFMLYSIKRCITLSGSGPYTAMRTMQSLLYGIQAGNPDILCHSLALTSFETQLQQQAHLLSCYQILHEVYHEATMLPLTC